MRSSKTKEEDTLELFFNGEDSSDDDHSYVYLDEDEFNTTAITQIKRDTLTLEVTPRHDVIGSRSHLKTTQFCATVTATDVPIDDDSARAPVDIVVALDTSGSMRGKKLELCKETLKLLLRELSPQDRFGLVTFGNTASVHIPTRELTNENRDLALSRVNSIRPCGRTNLSGGIGLAAQEILAIENPHGVRTIFLLTDGHANVGVFDRTGVVELTQGCLGAKGRSTSIHCFGYGSDHDREMLSDISQVNEGGTYYFISDDSDVSSAFGDALGGILTVVAQNVTVTIRSPPGTEVNQGCSIVNVHHDKVRKREDGSFTVELGDFYAEETRDVVFDVSLSTGFTTDEFVPHVAVSISYLDTLKKNLVNTDPLLGSIYRPHGSEMISSPNQRVTVQWLRIQTTQVIADAENIAESNLNAARNKIDTQIGELQREETSGLAGKDNLIMQLLSELSAISTKLTSKSTYERTGASYMQMKRLSHVRQRCSEPSSVPMSAYRSPGKLFMSRKFSNKE